MKDFFNVLPQVIGLLVGIPCICGIINTIISNGKGRHLSNKEIELKLLEEKRKIMELEIEKQKTQLLFLQEENRKYDNIIRDS